MYHVGCYGDYVVNTVWASLESDGALLEWCVVYPAVAAARSCVVDDLDLSTVEGCRYGLTSGVLCGMGGPGHDLAPSDFVSGWIVVESDSEVKWWASYWG